MRIQPHSRAAQACLWSALGLLATIALGPPPAQAAVIEAWIQRYNGPANSSDSAYAVAVDRSGNVAVTGPSSNGTDSDYYTAKYAARDGALLWEKRGPVGGANTVAVDGSGNVVVAGYSNKDYYTAKYASANGALLWEHRYDGPADINDDDNADYVSAVAVDASDNVVVTGYSIGRGSNIDYYTAKYGAADGALLWEQRYNGPANNNDLAQAIAVDSNGNMVVTGNSFGSGSDMDYYTAKYAAADGALLWERRYNGPGNSGDGASAVAVDGNGNAVVTGFSFNMNFTNPDYYTAKYAAADGALLWEKRYNGPANSDDWAQAVAVDGSGNVVVTGYCSTGTNSHYYTVKYAATDGELLWEQCHTNGIATAVTLDGNGNVLVTGSSHNGSNYDYYTAKYAATDGAVLWEKRYNGPANGYDNASSLALGPNGMVAVTGSSSGDYATVVYRENLPPVSIDLVPTGIRLHFTGVPGRSYNIERANAVTGPWTTLATPTAPIGGLIEYVDTNAPVGTAFYRTSAP